MIRRGGGSTPELPEHQREGRAAEGHGADDEHEPQAVQREEDEALVVGGVRVGVRDHLAGHQVVGLELVREVHLRQAHHRGHRRKRQCEVHDDLGPVLPCGRRLPAWRSRPYPAEDN